MLSAISKLQELHLINGIHQVLLAKIKLKFFYSPIRSIRVSELAFILILIEFIISFIIVIISFIIIIIIIIGNFIIIIYKKKFLDLMNCCIK